MKTEEEREKEKDRETASAVVDLYWRCVLTVGSPFFLRTGFGRLSRRRHSMQQPSVFLLDLLLYANKCAKEKKATLLDSCAIAYIYIYSFVAIKSFSFPVTRSAVAKWRAHPALFLPFFLFIAVVSLFIRYLHV